MSVKEKASEARKSKKIRIGVILGLMGVVLLLMVFFKKGMIAFTVILVLLAVALGLEGFNYDADIQKLWETGSYSQSRVESIKDKNGDTIRLIGSCVKADVNCAEFDTQEDAQSMYNTCAAQIEANNDVKNVKSLDIYGLDGDKDGIVCESLPKAQL